MLFFFFSPFKKVNFKVLVVGDGNLLDRMKEEANKLGLAGDIDFLGKIQNTAEIYKVSDVTINCSLKEGLALTSYESLSMNVPVISSNVGGQKELITEEVGAIVELRQDEKEIYLEEYKEQEINSYVEAIDKILNNLNTYKQNCRKRICEHFTIDKMIENMGQILEDVKQNPNPEKIRNGQGLATNLEISKELITANLKSDEAEYAWNCMEYEKKVYGRAFSTEGMNYKKELLKEKLWNIPIWRNAIKVYHKLMK